MGWFEEQLRQRRMNDQEIFEDSVLKMASAVLGKHRAGLLSDERIVTQAAIDEVLKYYHFKPVTIPGKIEDPGERLEYALRPHGLMYRNVILSGSWYREAYGPMLVRRREDGRLLVLLPRPFSGYYWTDGNGRENIVNKETMAQFDSEALCFYKPLPQRKIGISDLISYIKDCMDMGDCVVLVALTFMVTLTGMMMPRMTRLLTGFVIDSGRLPVLWGTAVFIFCVVFDRCQCTITICLIVLAFLSKSRRAKFCMLGNPAFFSAGDFQAVRCTFNFDTARERCICFFRCSTSIFFRHFRFRFILFSLICFILLCCSLFRLGLFSIFVSNNLKIFDLIFRGLRIHEDQICIRIRFVSYYICIRNIILRV